MQRTRIASERGMADFSEMDKSEYILGTADEELNRLRRQHELWKEELLKLWRHAGFHRGQNILELGCGPGFTTSDLARWLGNTGEVTAIDASERYLNILNSRPREATDAKIKTVHSYIESLNLPNKQFDGAFCRWLMIFVPKPEDAIRVVHSHLKPGAQFAIQEYVAWDTTALCPEKPSTEKVVRAVFQSWRDQGGDPNRGRILPHLLEKNKFRVTRIEPVLKAIRPTEPLFEWPETFMQIFLPTLVPKKYLEQKDVDQFLQDMEELKKTPGAFYLGPTLVNIIAERL